MPSIITAGDATNGASLTAGSNGTLIIRSGLAGAKVNALVLAASGTATLLAPPVNAANPCFSAFQSVGQSLSAGVPTKMSCQTEEFDTANAFSAGTVVTNGDATNRFTPLIAGYYQVSAAFAVGVNATLILEVRKNGSPFKSGATFTGCTAAANSCLVFMNGSTDFLEAYAFSSSATTISVGASSSYFQAALISRSA